jgi:agmatine deiminase
MSDDPSAGWRMPAETTHQERVWMAFPTRGSSIAETERGADSARAAWSSVAHAIAQFEPVRMLVDPTDVRVARRMISGEIELIEAPLDDAWMRDIGPTFVLGHDGNLGAVDWVFNGWGQQEWAQWERDAHIGRTVAALAGGQAVPSQMVNEGGGIAVDGLGTVLVTATVQLDPDRNPGLDQAAVEAELARTIGAEHTIWLPRGLTRDAQALGTRGHVDMVAAIPAPGRLLVHSQTDRSHPDHAITQEIVDLLRCSRDVTGAPWEIVEIPAPATLRDEHGWVDYNYINHVVVNGGVIACRFDDPRDDEARELLAGAYPGREVVTVDARAVFACGGGLHCITLQQPSARSAATEPTERSAG